MGGQILEYFGHLRGGVDQAYLKQLIHRFDLYAEPGGADCSHVLVDTGHRRLYGGHHQASCGANG